MEYPEHEKLAKIAEESQAIGEFLDYTLPGMGLTLCERDDESYSQPRWFPTRRSIQSILAEAFGIDENALELEKRAMLDSIRGDQIAIR